MAQLAGKSGAAVAYTLLKSYLTTLWDCEPPRDEGVFALVAVRRPLLAALAHNGDDRLVGGARLVNGVLPRNPGQEQRAAWGGVVKEDDRSHRLPGVAPGRPDRSRLRLSVPDYQSHCAHALARAPL